MKTIIQTDQAPAAIGAYSQAVQHGNTLYISGQIPLDPATMTVVEGDIKAQIEQVFTNFGAILAKANIDFSHVLQMRVYLTDLNDFAAVNEVMAKHVPEPFPARAAIEVSALPKGVGVEIEGIAAVA